MDERRRTNLGSGRSTLASCARAAIAIGTLIVAAHGSRADQAGVMGAGAKPPTNGNVVDLAPRPLGPSKAEGAAGVRAPGDNGSAWVTMNPSLRTGASLGIVLVGIVVLAGIAKAVVRKNGAIGAALGAGASPAGILEVLGRYPIARGHSLVLLKIERRILLLAHTHGKLRAGGGSISVLCHIDDPEDVASILLKAQEASGSTTAGRFQELLHAFGAGHDDGVDVVDARSPRLERRRDADTSAAQSEAAGDEPAQFGLRIADFEQQMAMRQQQERARSLARGGR